MKGTEDDSTQNWAEDWLAEDYSWNGLLKKKSWKLQDSRNLQDFIRGLGSARRTDEELIGNSTLLQCGDMGLFHIFFIPLEWTQEPRLAPLSQEELQSAQAALWSAARSAEIPDNFRGIISGAHITEEVGGGVVGSTRANFLWTSFECDVRGIPKRAGRVFEHCLFRESVFLTETLTDSAPARIRFQDCELQGLVQVGSLAGTDEIEFNTCLITGRLDFKISCEPAVTLKNCSIFTFDSLGCIFKKTVDLFENSISARLSLMNCVFTDHLSLVTANIHALELLSCDFKERFTYSEISVPIAEGGTASAEGSKFYGPVTFSGPEPPPVQLFHDAEFSSSASFSAYSDRDLMQRFKAELAVARAEGSTPADVLTIESGCRTLRKLAEARGDVHREHFWHRAEIIARRERGESTRAERTFSRLYGLFADYGLSIARPFSMLALTTLAFALLYAWVGGRSLIGSSMDWHSVAEGLGYSLNRTVPIGVFSDDSNIWRRELLGSGGELSRILIRTMATIQSVVSAVLIYLGIMAVRRKFRIS